MDRPALALVALLLAGLASLGIANSCTALAGSPAPVVSLELPAAPSQLPAPLIPTARPAPPPPATDLPALPNTCARVFVELAPDGGPRLTKERAPWMTSHRGRDRWAHQRRIRALVALISHELGLDAAAERMVFAKMISESSGREGNLHLLNADLEANESARRHRHASELWARARVDVWRAHRGEVRRVGTVGAWGFGRGLLGMVTGLHAHRWPSAPPWALCDPVIATVTMVWAMRAGLDECGGSTLRDAHRRFASGRCAIRPAHLERRFDKLGRGHVRGLELPAFDPDAPAQLGERFIEGELSQAGRARLHARLWGMAREHGLLL